MYHSSKEILQKYMQAKASVASAAATPVTTGDATVLISYLLLLLPL